MFRQKPRMRPDALFSLMRALFIFGSFACAAFVLWWLWQGDAGGASGNQPVAGSRQKVIQELTRTGYGPNGSEVQVVLVTPEYLELTGQTDAVARYAPDEHVIFFITEHSPFGDFSSAGIPELSAGGHRYAPRTLEVLVDISHHRFSVAAYARYDEEGNSMLHKDSAIELILPFANQEHAQSRLVWEVPAVQGTDASPRDFSFSWIGLLGLFGGLLASMWPCLFQLTAYFIPSVAGLSMAEVRAQDNASSVRLRVLKTALFFTLGIVAVYTFAGAAAGYAAQSFAYTSFLETWRRPVSLVAGIIIFVMAVHIAMRARAPWVCRMPLSAKLGKKFPEPLGTMILGVAFATGCMTCFGAAMVLGMLTYVFSVASVFSGALIFFLFSLGISIPLVAAAIAMARALSLLGTLERWAPWLVMGSSLVMMVFAVLLVSDNYHAVSTMFGAINGK